MGEMGETGTVEGGRGHGDDKMDSAGDVDSGFARLGGGLMRSVDQRGGASTAVAAGRSGLAGD